MNHWTRLSGQTGCGLGALLLALAALAQTPDPAAQARSNQLILIPLAPQVSVLERTTPAERAIVRERVQAENFDLRSRVSLDANEESQLIELLVDQTLIETDSRGRFGAWGETLLRDFEQRLQQVKQLLGEQRLAAYLSYENELPVRRRIVQLDARLDAAAKLSQRQKEQLVTVLARDDLEELRDRRKVFAFVPEDAQEARALVRKFDLERYEFDFRNQRQVLRLELDAVRTLLTPTQRAVFERVETEKLQSLQSYVENMRVAAGLSRTIPD